jgi:hypothetical protein
MSLEQKIPKNPKKYLCKCCDYNTYSKKDFSKHCSTRKHQNREKEDISEHFRTKNPKTKQSDFLCEKCSKQYNSRSGLWNHGKKCSPNSTENSIVHTDVTNPSIILEIIKQNQEFKSLLIEQQKTQLEQQKENKELINKVIELSREPRIVNNGSMTQNNNQKFNLQFFLHDTCKDAITIEQFISNIQISLEDLEGVGKNGFVKGISDIILQQLNTLDVTKRPIHCTDLKREVIYLKEDQDKWNRDDNENTKLKSVIRNVENKSWNKIPEWQHENPSVMVSDTPEYHLREKIMRNVCGNENAEKLREKIVRVLAKETQLDATPSIQ